MIPAVSFVGHHDSGKTTLLVRILEILAERGYRVGTVKHAPNLDDLESSDTDSAEHRAAGAARVLLRGARTSALFWEHDRDEDPRAVVDRLFDGCDLILIEGYKNGPWPKIEVFRRGRSLRRDPLAGDIDVVAIVTDDQIAVPDGVFVFSPRRPQEIADFVEGLLFPEEP
jgi:molybdopterin-guanine dinucleotide biosynthesis protein MobB